MKEKLFKLAAIMVIMGSFVGGLLWMQYKVFVESPLISHEGKAVTFMLKPGTSVKQLATQLQADGVIQHPQLFAAVARLNGFSKKLQAGEYKIKPGMYPKALFQNIVNGKVVLHKQTFIEGWTFKEMMTAINNNPYLKHELKGLASSAISQILGFKTLSPEGLFFPDTYRFPRGTSDLKLLRIANKALEKKLAANWQTRAVGLPYQDPYQALVAASLIEKETALPRERPLIAGVLVRRLQKKMPLQIDASVIYGLGDAFDGDITKKDLRRKTPYNTYVHRGLPPTPIAMSSAGSIAAALQPAPGKALYFVARGDGSHVFSDNLRDHNKAVKKYILLEQAKVVKP